MTGHLARVGARSNDGPDQGWLMRWLDRLTRRAARPTFLYPGELSPHLLRDIGLEDGRAGRARPPS